MEGKSRLSRVAVQFAVTSLDVVRRLKRGRAIKGGTG